MLRVSFIAAALLVISAGSARAQEQVMVPLADVARQAEAAKATARKAKKTYTNANLTADPRGDTASPPAPAPVAAVASTPEATPPATAAAAASGAAPAEGEVPKESEESWRTRAGNLRTQADRLRARMADLTVPNRLRDEDPGVKAATDREITNTRSAVDALKKQWARLEMSAIERKIPMAWIQPQPEFPQ